LWSDGPIPSLIDAYPTGGCEDGRVDEDFRVRGFRNLRLIDAGLLPIAVPEPQLSLMALASHAATRIASG
jgi:choline dehydrogenase-like flavoprotein